MKKFLISLALASLACCAWGVEPQTNPNIDHGLRTNPSVIPSAVRATWRAILSVPEKTELDAANASRDSYASSSRSIGDAMDSSQNALASAAYGYSSDTRSISAAMDNSQNALASSAADYASGTRAILTTLTTAVATGTSGTKVPLLDGANTWSGAQTMSGANFNLGTNFLSGDGGNEGLSIDSSGNATFTGDLKFGTGAEFKNSDGNRFLRVDGTSTSFSTIFYAGTAAEKMRITNTGIGIGTTTPSVGFQTVGTTAPCFDVSNRGFFFHGIYTPGPSDPGTATIFIVNLANANDSCYASMKIVGCDSNLTGAESWTCDTIIYNSSGVIKSVATISTAITIGTPILDMDDPTLTWVATGTNVALQIYMSEAAAGYAIRGEAAGYHIDSVFHY